MIMDFLRGLGGMQHERAGRGHDAFAMAQEIGGHAVHIAGTVEHGGALPRAMIGRAHDGHVGIMPSAIVVGFDIGSDSHL
jgi:hypothetical protein